MKEVKKIYPKNFSVISGATFRGSLSRSECVEFETLHSTTQWIGTNNKRVKLDISITDDEVHLVIKNTLSMQLGEYDYKIIGVNELGDTVIIKHGLIRVVG